MKKNVKKLIGGVVMIAAMAISVQMNKAEALSDIALENLDAIAMASGETQTDDDCYYGCVLGYSMCYCRQWWYYAENGPS